MENCVFIVILILMIITFFQHFIRRCYIGGQIFVLDLTLQVYVKQSSGTIIIILFIVFIDSCLILLATMVIIALANTIFIRFNLMYYFLFYFFLA